MDPDRGLSERLVAAVGGVYGVHAGHRAVHAKGTCCEGVFTPTAAAATLTTASHMTGPAIPVTVRFSNASGRPDIRDSALDGRGMAVKFHLPGGVETDIVCIDLPVFFVRTPEDFLEFLEARRPDPETGRADIVRVADFISSHPESSVAAAFLMTTPPPVSFARSSFFGIHAFRWTDSGGTVRHVRYRFEPELGEERVDPATMRELHRDYFRRDLDERLSAGPFAYRMAVQIAGPTDPLDDPTAAWPDDRTTVEVGRLEITAVGRDQEGGCERLVFDPARLVAGIELSDDPILRARSGAYSVSIERRLGLPPPG